MFVQIEQLFKKRKCQPSGGSTTNAIVLSDDDDDDNLSDAQLVYAVEG